MYTENPTRYFSRFIVWILIGLLVMSLALSMSMATLRIQAHRAVTQFSSVVVTDCSVTCPDDTWGS